MKGQLWVHTAASVLSLGSSAGVFYTLLQAAAF